MKSGKILTFCNMKGGVGKTTLCYLVGRNIALSSSLKGKPARILFVDFDAQANLSYMARCDYATKPQAALGELLTELMKEHDTIPVEIMASLTKKNTVSYHTEIRKTPVTFDVITTNSSFEVTRSVLEANSTNFYLQFPDWMDFVRTQYDYILIDTPPRMDIATIAPLLKSDYYMVVVTPDPKAYKGAQELVTNITKIARQIVSSSVFLGVIVNMVSRTNLSNSLVEIIERGFGKESILPPMLPSREAFRTILDTNERFVDDTIGELTANIIKKIKKSEA